MMGDSPSREGAWDRMKHVDLTAPRTVSVCTLGLFLIEALFGDGNGCEFGFGDIFSNIILLCTVGIGVVVSSVLLWFDGGWRAFHFGCLVVYLVTVLPAFMG